MNNLSRHPIHDPRNHALSHPTEAIEIKSAFVHNHRIRTKPHEPWEHAQLMSNGQFTENLGKIAKRHPELTAGELRVCALIKCMFSSRDVAELLRIEERSVERCRVRIRKKLKLIKRNLQCYLLEL